MASFDDDPIASWLRLGLTMAALPHEPMGRMAVELLLAGSGEAGPRLAPMPLIVRSSIATRRG